MINVNKLSSVPLNNLEGLPVQSGVYLALDSATRVWYVGSSENLRQRLKTHNKLDDFRDNQVVKIAYFMSENIKEDEADTIKTFDPPLNSKNDYRLPYVLVDDLSPQQCFERYFELKSIIKELEAEAENLKPNVVSYIENNADDGKKYVGKNVRAWITNRPNYEYSPEVQKLEKQIKDRKKKEVDEGIAKITSYTVYPTIRLI